ncbi:MAG: hypothetical protein ACK5DG_01150 [Chitinophagaceae bacterium]
MKWTLPAPAFIFLALLFTSCHAPQMLIKQEAKIDTLNLQFDFRIVQPYEYRQLLEQRLEKFVSVYNGETHPFKLSLNSGDTLQSCAIKITRSKFVSKKQSNLHLGYSVLGLGTFSYLLATGFPVPVGWVFIPRARTTLEPKLSSDISDVEGTTSIGIISSGMYRSQQKQMDIQSTKFLKYIVSIVQTVEADYQQKKQ